MKKLAVLLVLVFGLGAVVGMRTTPAQAASCYWTCICSVAYKCCRTEFGTKCKVDPAAPIGCPQVAC